MGLEIPSRNAISAGLNFFPKYPWKRKIKFLVCFVLIRDLYTYEDLHIQVSLLLHFPPLQANFKKISYCWLKTMFILTSKRKIHWIGTECSTTTLIHNTIRKLLNLQRRKHSSPVWSKFFPPAQEVCWPVIVRNFKHILQPLKQ